MSLNGVDPAAKTGSRVRRNWARTTKGAIVSTIPAVQPIAVSGSGNLTLNLATNPGLTPSGQALSILLPASSGLSLGATGLKLLLTTNSGLQLLTTGLGILLPTNSGLALAAGGLSIGAVTTKGDLLGYGTFPTRLGVGTDSQFLIADSTQTLGVKWGSSVANLTVTTAFVSNGTAAFNGNVSFNSGVSFTTLTATADGNSFGSTTITNVSTANAPLTINTPSFQVADLQVWKNFGTQKANLSASGLLTVTGLTVSGSVQGSITFAGDVLHQGNTTIVGLVANGTETHSGNVTMSGNNTLSGATTATGALTISNATTTHGVGDRGSANLGVGYTCTSSLANTGLSITLPAAGTYLIMCQVRTYLSANIQSGGQSVFVQAQLNNITDAVIVGASTLIDYGDNFGSFPYIGHQQTSTLVGTATVTAASKVICLQASITLGGTSSGSASVIAGGTQMTYVRIA